MATRAGAAPPSREGAFGSSGSAAEPPGLFIFAFLEPSGRQPSSRRAHRSIRLPSDPGLDGTRTFKACGEHDSAGAGVIAGGAAKSHPPPT